MPKPYKKLKKMASLGISFCFVDFLLDYICSCVKLTQFTITKTGISKLCLISAGVHYCWGYHIIK